MSSASGLIHQFSEVGGLLTPVLPPDTAAEAPAIFFFLKAITTGTSSRPWAHQLPSATWEQLSRHETPETALLKLLERVESLAPEFKGLSTQSHLARNLSGRTDLRPQLRRACDYVAQITLSELSPAKSAQIFQDLLQRFEQRTTRPSTPPRLAHFAVHLVSSKEAKSVFDPSCGSGDFLSAAAMLLPTGKALVLEGEESQESTALLARIALWLGGWRAHIHVPDDESVRKSFDEDRRTFDIIVTNPPFGLRLEGPVPFSREGNRSNKLSSEVAFVSRIDHALTRKGRAAVLVPIGLLSRQGSDYYLRKDLVTRDRLAAVITLPGNLFAQTKVYVALLVLHADKVPTRKGQVVFVDFSEGGSRLDDDVAEEIRRVISGGDVASGAMRVVERAEIIANDFELAVWRYLSKKKHPVDAPSFRVAFAAFQQAAERRNVSEREALREIAAANQVLAKHSASMDEGSAL